MSVKFNPFTGTFDFVGQSSGPASPDNFSYTEVSLGKTVTVPAGQEMIVSNPVIVDGNLNVQGNLTQLVDASDWSFSWNRIPSGKVIRIPPERDMIVYPGLMVEGVLLVEGRLLEMWV